MSKMIRVVSTKYDGSPRDEWPAYLLEAVDARLTLHIPSGAEEIVKGSRRQIIAEAFTAHFWTDRWYNVWEFEREEGTRRYANVATPCTFDGELLRWVDLELDVVQYCDGAVLVKDQDEFDGMVSGGTCPPEIVERALQARDELVRLLSRGANTFSIID